MNHFDAIEGMLAPDRLGVAGKYPEKSMGLNV
jgi:hypothetical protein